MKMGSKSLCQILEGQEALLNSAISSLDLNETNSRTVRPLLEYLRQDIRAHLLDMQDHSSTTQAQEDSTNVEQLVTWMNELDKRLSKLDTLVDSSNNALQSRLYLVESLNKSINSKVCRLEERFPEEERMA